MFLRDAKQAEVLLNQQENFLSKEDVPVSCLPSSSCPLCPGPFTRMLEMMCYTLTKGGKLRNIIMHNVIWANQKTEFYVYRWLGALAIFDVVCFPAFLGALDVISIVTSVNVWITRLSEHLK